MKTPCKGCMSRREACHAECEKYIAFRKKLDERREAAKRERVVQEFSFEKAIKKARAKQSLLKK